MIVHRCLSRGAKLSICLTHCARHDTCKVQSEVSGFTDCCNSTGYTHCLQSINDGTSISSSLTSSRWLHSSQVLSIHPLSLLVYLSLQRTIFAYNNYIPLSGCIFQSSSSPSLSSPLLAVSLSLSREYLVVSPMFLEEL